MTQIQFTNRFEGQNLDLMKHERMRRINIIATIDPSGSHDPEGWFTLFELPNLDGRSMGPQHEFPIFTKIKRVLHISRRMILGTIQGLEAIIVRFNFRRIFTSRDGIISQLDKDIDGLFHGHTEWMTTPDIGRIHQSWHGHIDFLIFHLLFELLQFQSILGLAHEDFERILDFIHHGTETRLVLTGKIAHVLHGSLNRTLLSHGIPSQGFGLGQGRAGFQLFHDFDLDLFQFLLDLFDRDIIIIIVVVAIFIGIFGSVGCGR
mmetsp:Transcript_130382/g.364849  ORF Transcript_130382/g.364849 Transcript_130382/m.364849 type:complete len:262 (-) Transcript_130382:156-941(-)